MKIAYHLYELKGRNRFTNRKGALLRAHFQDGIFGYADCHPWEELGDLPLGQQLNLLRQEQYTALTGRSLYYAQLDANAREHGLSIFHEKKIPPSHWLFSGDLNEFKDLKEFTHIKIKFNNLDDLPFLQTFLQQLPDHIKVRVDCNAKFNSKQFQKVLAEIKGSLHRVEYFEDPIPFNREEWMNLKIPLACDQDSEQAIGTPFTTVIKPAVQDTHPFFGVPNPLVITSYLDHPIGQLAAAYTATQLPCTVCGLLSHAVYQTNDFSEQLVQMGPDLQPPEGTGFGFDKLLESLNWTQLS